MPNIIKGTQNIGKLSKTDDGVITINHFGSIVKIMWPQQGTDNVVFGYADVSRGSIPGKLSNNWEFGDYFNVEKYGHMSLYCYSLVAESGTLDDVLIRIEKKPIINAGPIINQVIEYQSSGSFTTETVYTDEIHRKSIDYGDISIKEHGWGIDIPLENIKDIRIAAKHKNGQSLDTNKSLIVYGRFLGKNE